MSNWRIAGEEDLFKCNVLLIGQGHNIKITREMKNINDFTHEPSIVDNAIKKVVINKSIYEHEENVNIEVDVKKYNITVKTYKINEEHYHVIGVLN